jgi:primary-amine oxidase
VTVRLSSGELADRLAPLSHDEIRRSAAAIRSAGGRPAAFVSISLREPDWRTCERSRAAEVIWVQSGETHEALIDLTTDTVIQSSRVQQGQAAFVPSEVALVDELVRADPRFRSALERRGIDPDDVEVGLFPAGNRELPEAAAGQRVFRTSCWMRTGARPYTAPVEGIVGIVDVGARKVLDITDGGTVPVPPRALDFHADLVGETRGGLRPLEIVQPQGESFELSGNLLRWQKWSILIGFTPREGLVLHGITYRDGDTERPVMRRASLSEMVVPYAHAGHGHYDRAVFDAGEAMFGLCANELELGCDCLGVIRYLDAVVNDEAGDARTIRNAICIHEEDEGILWKHTDADGHREVRRSRRLVVSWFATLDNYDYGFFWYFRQDGSIEMEVKLTGIVLVEAVGEAQNHPHGNLVAPQLNGILHQHFFCFRLHMDVDGGPNQLTERQSEAIPLGPDNPYGNAFTTSERLLESEHAGQRDTDPAHARSWKISNTERRNALGQATSYLLMPGDQPLPLAHESSSFMRRAGFARHSLWATPYTPGELYAAGDYPNQHPGGAGLPSWTADDRSLVGGDLVLWHTVGAHHWARPEDWPVMPVTRIGFMLKPSGFFDHNPANDLPAPAHAHAPDTTEAQDGGRHDGCCH